MTGKDRWDLNRWRKHQSAEQREDSYARWRASFPWTNDQFAAAIRSYPQVNAFMTVKYERMAQAAEKGVITAAILRTALPALITTCAVCAREGVDPPKKALYRAGLEGRCKVHRMVPEKWSSHRSARIDRHFNELAVEKDKDDRVRRSKEAFHRNCNAGKRRR